jgi:hypothetical protein
MINGSVQALAERVQQGSVVQAVQAVQAVKKP